MCMLHIFFLVFVIKVFVLREIFHWISFISELSSFYASVFLGSFRINCKSFSHLFIVSKTPINVFGPYVYVLIQADSIAREMFEKTLIAQDKLSLNISKSISTSLCVLNVPRYTGIRISLITILTN